MEQNGAGFSYESPTEECSIFKNVVTQQRTGGMSLKIYSKEEKDRYNMTSLVYEGRMTCTVKGVTCQRWDSNKPHIPSYFIGRSDLQNWCQIKLSKRPWCYTMDPKTRWDYCPVDEISSCNRPPPLSLPGISVNVEHPYNFIAIAARYRCAKSLDSEPVISCPVTRCLPDGTWSSANVSCAKKECYDPINKTYNGSVTCTETGVMCQRWDSNFPHVPHKNKGRSDFGNRCVIQGYTRPWCQTVDPLVPWDWCPVDPCT
ncbi:plasminogen-like [Ylistrum balloti]|uniref:plasminogen-like n=1 Tax=Ylistrum balloti TaxID=509963 RepID=UPI002905BA2A|nr:plasminogen-like [Ylistrum balloti]